MILCWTRRGQVCVPRRACSTVIQRAQHMPSSSAPPPPIVVKRLRERYGDPYLVKDVEMIFKAAAETKSAATAPPPPPAAVPAQPAAAIPAPTPVVETPAAPPPETPPASKPTPALVLVAAEHATGGGAPNGKSDDYKAGQAEVDSTLKDFKALDLRKLPPVVQRTLAWMRKTADDVVRKDPSIKPSAEMGHDLRLLRFLIGSKWDPKSAAEDYVAALKKRKELGTEKLRDEMVAANADFFERGSSALSKVHFHPSSKAVEKSMPRLWVVPQQADGPFALTLHKEGHLNVCDYAPDFDKISGIGASNWALVEMAFQELQILVLDELSKRDGVLRMACKVTDVRDRESELAKSMAPITPFSSAGEKQFSKTGGLAKAMYPTVVYKWFMVNLKPSYKGKVQWAISQFGGRSKHKMIVCDHNYQALVQAEVDARNLPEQLSGELPAATFAAS